jgi:hypothetical protein
MLESSKRMVMEIEDVAADITAELGRNRETIQSAHNKVRGEAPLHSSSLATNLLICRYQQVKTTAGNIEESNTVLRRMGGWFRNLS